MFIGMVQIIREGYSSYSYNKPDPTKPFRATIEVYGATGKIELFLDADMSRRILEIVADEVAKAGRAAALAMTAEAFDVVALPAPAEQASAV